jgi:hypothetical protein
MSVKFEKDTIKQTGGVAGAALPTMKGGKHELADEIGTALTGGKGNVGQPGYLAVSDGSDSITRWMLMDPSSIGIPQAASDEPPPNQDAHIWHTFWITRVACIMDRQGSQ